VRSSKARQQEPVQTNKREEESSPAEQGEREGIARRKGNLRMRRNPNIIRPEATIEPQQALIGRDPAETIDHALIRQLAVRAPLLFLQPRLDEIEGQRQETGEEAGDGGGGHGLRKGGPLRAGFQLSLCFREESQLAEIQRHGAHDSREGATPESGDALGLGDVGQGVEDGAVIGAGGLRLEAVGLHADEGEVGRVADHGGQAAGGEAGQGAFLEADALAVGLGACRQLFHEGVEEAEAGGRVDGLAEEAGGEAGVEVHEAAAGDDLPRHLYGAGAGTGLGALAGQLEADFDHVDGLDDGRGRHAAQTAVDEGEGGAHPGFVEKVVLGRLGFVCGLFCCLDGLLGGRVRRRHGE